MRQNDTASYHTFQHFVIFFRRRQKEKGCRPTNDVHQFSRLLFNRFTEGHFVRLVQQGRPGSSSCQINLLEDFEQLI